jgi:hypothetical protein
VTKSEATGISDGLATLSGLCSLRAGNLARHGYEVTSMALTLG